MSPLKIALLSLGLLSAATAQAGNLLCCQDPSTGRKTCGDSLPELCRGRAYKILDSAGNVIKEVAAPLTAEQKLQAAAEVQRKKELEAAQREQYRKDQALLDTYSSLQDIERAKSRSESEVQEAIRQAENRISTLQKQRKKFETDAEAYRNKIVPAEITKGMREADSEIKAQQGLLSAKTAELNLVRSKYDQDKRRYSELSGTR